MDDHDDFDSVSWRHEAESDNSRPNTSEASRPLPIRHSSGKRKMSGTAVPQAGQLADPVDLGGIGDGILECTVDSPMKENDGTKDAYMSYLVTTHTDFKSFQKSEFSVRRRFTDFVFLRNTLSKEYAACAVPPLPEKNNIQHARGGGFSSEFVQRRAWSLHRFIKRLTLHPVLRRAPIFILFLETNDWNAQMRMRPTRSNTGSETAGSAGLFDRFADTFVNAFSKVHKPDKRFIEVVEKANKLDEDLVHVEKIVARVARRESDLETDYAELANNMRKLVPLEPAVDFQLQTFAGSVDETSRGWRSLKDHTDNNYLGSLRDMEAYIVSVKSMLKTREQKQLDFEALTEYLARTTSDRDLMASSSHYSSPTSSLNPAAFFRNKMEDMRGVDHETARREQIKKLELRIEELTREADNARVVSMQFDEQVMREVKDFERIKGIEFRDSLGSLATEHINFYQGVMDTWERFIEEMEEQAPAQPKDKGRAAR
ncbi:MAG: hypothetical protein Q9227_002435 [Pyrenula ochraceoflavens]